MIQTRPYEFMVQYTPQREWIEGQGIMLWLAFFFIELGAGTFIVSSIFGNKVGMLIGWIICAVLGGGFHLLYLGHPFRFWRIILSSGWKTSWISRGLYFVILFLSLGAIYMVLAQWSSPSLGLIIAANVFAFCTVVYAGFAMNYVNGIQLWNTPLLPVLYAVLGIWGGLGINLIILITSEVPAQAMKIEEWSRIFLLIFIFIVFIYLYNIRYQGPAAKASVRQMVAGRWALLFWVIVVVLGTAFPVGVVVSSWLVGSTIPVALLYITIIFELLADLVLRYCLLRCGLYNPLIPATSYTS